MSSQTFSTFSEVGMIDARLRSGTITLPLTTTIPYRILTLKDIYGATGLSTTTIQTTSPDVFEDGTSTRLLNTAYQSLTVYAGQPGKWMLTATSLSNATTIGTLNISTLNVSSSVNFISGNQFTSTVQGLGTAGYLSTLTGPAVSTQQIVTSSLGVGIAKPYRRLEVLSSMRIHDGTLQTPTLEFTRNATQGQAFGASASPDWVFAVSTGAYPNMNMYASYTGTTTNNLTLGYTGTVGINCNAPQYQLDVNGTIRTSGLAFADSMSTQSISVSSINGVSLSGAFTSTIRGLGTAGYISSVNSLSTATINVSSFVGTGVTVTNLTTSNLTITNGTQLITFNGTSNTTSFGYGYDSLSLQTTNASGTGGIASLFFGTATSSYPLSRMYAIDKGTFTSALVSQTVASGVTPVSVTFSGIAADQSYTVPAGVGYLTVSMWGAGGGTGNGGGTAGAGAYLKVTLAVTAGSVLKMIVGQGGTNNRTASTYGGGGGAGNANSQPAAGGGRSAIQLSNAASITSLSSGTPSSGFVTFNTNIAHGLYVNQPVVISGITTTTAYNGTYLITSVTSTSFVVSSSTTGSMTGTGTIYGELVDVAGGGGCGQDSTYGGPGGISVGFVGGGAGGGGATQTAGGVNSSFSTANGSVLQGGQGSPSTAGNNGAAGGGGGGYFGGAGAGSSGSFGGGGGGASYYSHPAVTAIIASNYATSPTSTAPGQSDSNWTTGIGAGGSGGSSAGGSGLIAITTIGVPFLTERMRIDGTGNVGIGVSSPQTLLHVSGMTYSVSMSTQSLLVSSINGVSLTGAFVSTVAGLGQAGYVSSTQLLSTSLGLLNYINSFIDPTELTSTVIGLGTGGFVSTLGLTYSLASTVTGLGTLGYISTSQLLSTTVGTYNAITAATNVITGTNLTSTVTGLGTAGYISSPNLAGHVSTTYLDSRLASTVQGLGTAGYISSPNLAGHVSTTYLDSRLASTVAGLGTAGYVSSTQLLSTSAGLASLAASGITQTQVTSSINNLLVPYSTLNSASFFNIDASTTQLYFGTYGSTSQIYIGDVLAANGNKVNTSPLLLMESLPVPGSLTTQTFTYTGADQPFIVPTGVTSINVTLSGAGGGFSSGSTGTGGPGGYVSGTLSVTPGETLQVMVGQGGTYVFNTGAVTYGGGGGNIGYTTPGGLGGGRSAIRRSGADIVTAGGGGGATQIAAGYSSGRNGGAGGGTTGAAGQTAGSAGGGGGGTQSAGGAGGGGTNYSGATGTLGVGGNGGSGGGGGYWGGGGGGRNGNFEYGAGGGGSSYVSNLTGTVVDTQGGGAAQNTNGTVTVTYLSAPTGRPGNILEIRNYQMNKFIVDTNLNVGINVSSITTGIQLDVNGTTRTVGISTQQIVTSSLGVGVAKPYRYLEVLSSMRIHDGALQTPTLEFTRNATQGQAFGASASADWVFAVSTGAYPNMNMYASYTGTTTNNLTLGYTGTVGINCNAPQYQLDVNGTIRTSGLAFADSMSTQRILVSSINGVNLAGAFTSTVAGLGQAGYVSTTQLLSTSGGLVNPLQLTSTVAGLGSAGYVSSTQLLSTSLGIKLYIDNFIDPTELTSTVIGLGTGGFVSTLGLTYSLASTVTGLGTLGYVSTSQLLSTTVGTYQAITAATNVITGTNLTSTVTGLGSAGYISSTQLLSTSAGLASLTQIQLTSSINNLLVPYSTLNTASYFQVKASTSQLYFGGYGSTAQVYMGDILAANGNLALTTPLLLMEQLVVPMPSYSNVFTYTSASNVYFTPPAGVTSINVVLVGAGGGGSGYNNGGAGGLVSGTLAVTPGVQITLLIGQGGGGVPYVLGNNPGSISSSWGGGGSGGYGGYGSSGCGAGGGRSAIIIGGVDVVAVGGGGGASSAAAGGAGGGTSGGSSSYNPGSGASGNTPGTGTNNGSLGTGGNGSVSAGGGGGGWYGGGSGTATAGAGGGGNANVSNLTGTVVNTLGGGASGGANGNYANNSAGSGGNGSITITYSSVNAYRPGNIVEIRNYLTNKFIVDPNLNVGINVSSITTGIQLDVNGTTRSINISTQQVSVSSINGFIPWQPSYITSTVQGLGSAGYISSPSLSGLVSTTYLATQLASTVTGLGSAGYISSPSLAGHVSTTYLATQLASTVIGLGSAGYISSTQLLSTSAGLAVASLAQTQSSINNLLVPYSTLNTASYFQVRASTSQLFFGGYGSTAQIYMGDVLAANGNTVTTNPLLLMESLPIPVPSVSQTFTYTGSDQQFTVPAGVTSLTVTLSGAAGACGYNGGGAGGSGGLVSGTLPVSPGQLLYLVVGAGGTYNSGATYGGGGSGGGSTGAGGGRSAIRSVASTSTAVPDTVTAGGGGGGGTANGGAGGGGTTNSGASGTNNAGDSSTGGGGGTTGAGGTAGSPGGTAGSLNTGGGGGRGGGGGYYGGGSGGATVYGSGGGGGSAYTANLTGTVTGSQGGGGGGGYYPATPGTNGYITIIYTPTPGVRPGNIMEIRNYQMNKFIIDPSLNVGINVSSINTSFALDVNGASRTQSVSTQQIVTSSLGVGIAKPYRRLEVLSSMRVYDGTYQTPTIEFIRNTTQGQAFGASANADWVIAVSTGAYPNMNMYTSYTGTTTNNMTLDYTGKVGINCNTPQYQLDINGISRSCLLLSNLSGTSVTLANSNFGTYFYLTNSGFSNITLTGTPSPAAGWYVSFRNNTTSYLSCTLSGQVSSTPASPLVIPPANSVTIAYDNSTSLYVLL